MTGKKTQSWHHHYWPWFVAYVKAIGWDPDLVDNLMNTAGAKNPNGIEDLRRLIVCLTLLKSPDECDDIVAIVDETYRMIQHRLGGLALGVDILSSPDLDTVRVRNANENDGKCDGWVEVNKRTLCNVLENFKTEFGPLDDKEDDKSDQPVYIEVMVVGIVQEAPFLLKVLFNVLVPSLHAILIGILTTLCHSEWEDEVWKLVHKEV